MKIRIFSILAFAVLLFCSFTSPEDVVDLSKSGTANCYIVSKPGWYAFRAVKGNSNASVGSVSSVAVLWESLGTDVKPFVGILIEKAGFSNGYIAFQTADKFVEGNAVIAAKDASGKILWSWHIWFTDQPEEQLYYNNAGIMMDRNLGATSATPGDVGALGLLYQWGRKDPFLGSSSTNERTTAKSTITWPSAVSSNSNNGTIEYATAHPTTLIRNSFDDCIAEPVNDYNGDWYYTGSEYTDNTRWRTSDKPKSIYDPCPAGWRVPDGGSNGVWSKAVGSRSVSFNNIDSTNNGINFSGVFGSASTIWYPASGSRDEYYSCSLCGVGRFGQYWSVGYEACRLSFDSFSGRVNSSGSHGCTDCLSVRCVKDSFYYNQASLNVSSATDLSSSGSANCYIVSSTGTYKLKAVKGNSATSVGSVAYAAILWETFGTSTAPKMLDLISAYCYKDGYIAFQTTDTFKEGNAVIAAMDVGGNILWSWHIWFTDQPEEQVYYNNAGIMMDRNLGATSATPGDVGALGLLYQWGRKDPFLCSTAKSTITWPSAVSSNSNNGTIEYATANPTTVIHRSFADCVEIPDYDYMGDWYYTGSEYTDNTRWTTSDKPKSIYDPCPAGWRVPDGGSNGVWSKALGSSKALFLFDHSHNFTNEGIDISGELGPSNTIWYPNTNLFYSINSDILCAYWSASLFGNAAYSMSINNVYYVNPSDITDRHRSLSVRCVKEIN